MRRNRLLLVPVLALGVIIAGCDDDDNGTGPITGGNGMLNMYLTDAPGDFDEVHITFSELSLRRQNASDTAWTTISTDSQTVDLLTLTNGRTELIGQAEVESGTYNEIRLLVESAQAVKDGQTFDVTVPSGAASGLKVMGDFEIQPDVETNLVLDFNVARSFHQAGASGQVIMNPVLRVANIAQTGGIMGSVDSLMTGLAAYALANNDTVSSSYIDDTNGQFKVSFLPPGTYLLVILNSEGMVGHSGSHAVNSGEDTDVGMLTLNFVPGDSIPGDTIPGDTIPGDTIPGDTIPGDTIPGDTIPGDTIPGDTIPGDTIPGDTIPGDTIPGDTIPGDTTLGYLLDAGEASLSGAPYNSDEIFVAYSGVAAKDRETISGEFRSTVFRHPSKPGHS